MSITDSILDTIKPLLGPSVSGTDFDFEIIIFINSIFMDLNILGVGPSEGYAISGNTETWTQYIGSDNILKMSAVKSFVYLKARMIFDPPQTAALLKSTQDQIDAYEVKINSMAEEV